MKRLLLIILLLTACSSQIKSVEINNIKIPVELAITNEQKAEGLMFRTNLTGGMLFVYDDEQPRTFWMKDTLIPLDMIFINSENNVVTIHHAIPCKNERCELYRSLPAKYVLEVNYNFTNENRIKLGSEVTLRQ